MSTISLFIQPDRPTFYSNRLHDFFVIILDFVRMSMTTVCFLIQQGKLTFYYNRLRDFSITILDVTRMLMSTVSFLIKQERSTFYSDRLHDFCHHFKYHASVSVTISFLIQADCGMLYL